MVIEEEEEKKNKQTNQIFQINIYIWIWSETGHNEPGDVGTDIWKKNRNLRDLVEVRVRKWEGENETQRQTCLVSHEKGNW